MDSILQSAMSSYGLTASQTQVGMGIFGILAGMLVGITIFAFIIYVLMIIAWWKIFKKAGEKGWKSLIPIYNVYLWCKIVGLSFWKWFITLFVLSLVAGFAAKVVWLSMILSIATSVVSIVFYVLLARNTARAFGKGAGFAVGLFFLPNIFLLILAFGSAEYKGVPSKN